MWFKHCEEVCMSYYEHMKLSLYISRIFAIASLKAIIHAFVPSLCITSSSDTVYDIATTLKNSGCRD